MRSGFRIVCLLTAIASGPCVGGDVAAVTADVSPSVIRSAPRGCHEVALTFDLCPVRGGGGFDEPLFDELTREKIPATFFVSGRWMTSHDSVVRRLLAVPFFEIETHGDRHAHLATLGAEAQRDEIEAPVDLLRSRFQRHAGFVRPPYGEYDSTTLDVAHALGLEVVLWSVASGDPDPHLSEASILADLADRVRDGAVILFHANGKGWHTSAVVEQLITKMLAERHLRPVTLAEMLRGCGQSSTR